MLTLDITERKRLSAQGHALNPVAFIGKAGLTQSVLDELDRSLLSHQLIKIKVHIENRDIRKSILEKICRQLNAAPIQHVGKIFVIFRHKPEDNDQEKIKTNKRSKREPRRTKRSFQT